MARLLSDRADRLVQRLFRPQPQQPPEEQKTDTNKILRTLRRRQSELDQVRKRI